MGCMLLTLHSWVLDCSGWLEAAQQVRQGQVHAAGIEQWAVHQTEKGAWQLQKHIEWARETGTRKWRSSSIVVLCSYSLHWEFLGISWLLFALILDMKTANVHTVYLVYTKLQGVCIEYITLIWTCVSRQGFVLHHSWWYLYTCQN